MPSAALYSRIQQFESLSSPRTVSPSPSPPNLGRRTSLIDLKDWVLDDGPRHPPLINLDSSTPVSKPVPPLPPRKPPYVSLNSVSALLGPPRLIPDAPPLSLDANARSRNSSFHAPASSISSFHSVSLSSDTDINSPGSVNSNFIATFPVDRPINSVAPDADTISLSESYEEVSTSSLASPSTERSISLDFEKAMAKRKQIPPRLPQRPPSIKSPPLSTPSSPIIRPSASLPYAVRRVPPPPPSRSSDRSSILSTATSASTSSHSHKSASASASSTPGPLRTKRPTPVPPAARRRYECVFVNNVLQRRRAQKQKEKEKRRVEREDKKPALLSPGAARGRGRRAAGWRGLSVDLITAGDVDESSTHKKVEESDEEDEGVDESIGIGEILEAAIVRHIWARSTLDYAKLAEIWTECDPEQHGALDRDAFVRGMWRIDEELRRTQLLGAKGGSTPSLASNRDGSSWRYSSNSLTSKRSKTKDILR